MYEAFSSSEAYQSLAAIETITVTGRTRQPLVRKLNLFWWFMNDFEPTPPDWYRSTQPLRTLFWYLRNPLQNAGRYVLGVADRNYTVTGMWPVLETVWGMCGGPTFHISRRDMAGSARRSNSRMAAPCRGFRTRHRAGWHIGAGSRTGLRA